MQTTVDGDISYSLETGFSEQRVYNRIIVVCGSCALEQHEYIFCGLYLTLCAHPAWVACV